MQRNSVRRAYIDTHTYSQLSPGGEIAGDLNFLCVHRIFYNFCSDEIFYNQLTIALFWKENTNLNYPMGTPKHSVKIDQSPM